ncbi:hypothetical protein MLP_42010 [Microlunatus phosphovorus NM-1]|uniref:Uncharacterized protein n=1 Tax=Microlunatus phosphovorus (strain ATCC 700054 / DSM 10555 / JCM 9379 / NBRC 101784 / NCIMB 13414 / VKM Ac-1990 / NM-1) TaxID=1032480 RepID=F5XS02_MICPN|nr:hypothetical protein MLP_42010 [Microlunatus phosphovorus NM-1]
MRRGATNDRRSGTPSRRLAPPGHKRSKAKHNTRTAAAGGPQTTGGQARPADGLRPRATNDRKPSTTPVRLPPAGHERSAVRRAQQTACAPGPQTIESQAQHPHGCRRRATNGRRSSVPRERLAPPGHKRQSVPRSGPSGERQRAGLPCERPRAESGAQRVTTPVASGRAAERPVPSGLRSEQTRSSFASDEGRRNQSARSWRSE